MLAHMTINHIAATSCDLPTPPEGWFDYAYQVGPDGRLLILRYDRDCRAEWEAYFSEIERGRPQSPGLPEGMRICVFDGEAETGSISLPSMRSPSFDRFENGDWVLAESRTLPGKVNALIYSSEGAELTRGHVGDGIEHLLTASDDKLWIGYFDEGIFGGAQDSSGRWPVSSGGVVRFDRALNDEWRLNDNPPQGLPVDDCYALSVNGSDVWSCYYSGFPIIHIAGERIRHFDNSVSGANAIAVSHEYVLLAGGYTGAERRLTLLRLTGGVASVIWQSDKALSHSSRQVTVAGRNGILHVVADGIWSQLRVEDLVASLDR